MVIFTFIGAGEGSRNPISSLENLHTNRCTTPAIYNSRAKIFQIGVFSERSAIIDRASEEKRQDGRFWPEIWGGIPGLNR